MKRWVAALAATVGLVVMAAAPASALPNATIDPAARTAALSAITSRLADLNARVTLVNQSPAMSATDRSTLLSELNSTISGLTALDTTITNETSVTAFRTESADIFSVYRVYALVLPQVHLVRASDEMSSVIVPGLQKVEAALQSRITGANTSATAADMSDLAKQITAIQNDTNGVPATLLALTPSQWNADHTVLKAPRRQLGAAWTAAGQALSDVKAVLAVLQ
jgi:hypothetical protein